MTATVIQVAGTSTIGTNTITATFGSATTAGSLIVAVGVDFGVAAFASGNVTDNKGGGSSTYALVPGSVCEGGAGFGVGIWYTANCAAGITQVTFAVTGSLLLGILECSGIGPTPLDKNSAGSTQAAVSSPVSGTTGTLTQADELAVAVTINKTSAANGTITPDTGFANIFENENASTGTSAFNASYKVVAATTAINHTWTTTVYGASDYISTACTFAATAVAATAVITHPTVPGISTDVVLMKNSAPTYTGAPKILIWAHGVNGDVDQIGIPGNPACDLWSQVIVNGAGRYILVGCDDGIAATSLGYTNGGGFGNDAAIAVMSKLVEWARDRYPGYKVALVGHSGGSQTGVSWATHGGRIGLAAGFVYVDGGLDMTYVRDVDVPTLATDMDNAYSPSTWNAQKADRDPVLIAGTNADLRRLQFLDFDATGDTFLSTTQNTNFVTAYGANCTRTTVASGDHDTVHDFIDPNQIVTFLDGLDWVFPGQVRSEDGGEVYLESGEHLVLEAGVVDGWVGAVQVLDEALFQILAEDGTSDLLLERTAVDALTDEQGRYIWQETGDELLVESATSSVSANANAVTADVTVTATNPVVSGTATASAVNALVTVTGTNPVARGAATASAVNALVTVTGTNPVVSGTANASAVNALVTVTGNNPVVSGAGNAAAVYALVTVTATNPAASGAGPGTANAVNALVTVTGNNAAVSGTATAAAVNALVTVTGTNPAVSGTATASAVAAVVTVTASNPTATGTATASAVNALVTVTATNPAASGGASASANAVNALVTVTANNPTTRLTGGASAVNALVTVTATNPVAQTAANATANAAVANVVVTATNPTVTRLSNANPPAALVTSTANNPTTRLTAAAAAVYALVTVAAANAASVRLNLRANTTSVRITSATVAAELTSSSGTDRITSSTATEDVE